MWIKNLMKRRYAGGVLGCTPSAGIQSKSASAGTGINSPATVVKIYKKSQVLPAFVEMGSYKGALIGMGDSNQQFGGHGWDYGIPYGLASVGYSMHSGPLQGAGNVGSPGYEVSQLPFLIGAVSGAPSQLADYWNRCSPAPAAYDAGTTYSVGDLVTSGVSVYKSTQNGNINHTPPNATYWVLFGLQNDDYAYGDDSATFTSNNNGASIQTACPMSVNDNLRWEVYYGTFPLSAGSGNMRLCIRYGESPFSLLAQGSAIDPTVPDAYGIALATLDIAAGTRDKILQGQIYNSEATVPRDLLGPWFLLYMRWRSLTATKGFSYQSIESRGGETMQTFARDIQKASDNTLSQYLTGVRAPLTGNKVVIITIVTGVNDRNETETSVGPSPNATGDSPAAYADNLQAIINRWKAVYTLNGWDTNYLYFLVIPSQVQSDPDDAELLTYRTAADGVADANINTAVVHLDRMVNFSAMSSGQGSGTNYYNSNGSDTFHMTQTAYKNISAQIVSEIYRPV